MGSGEAGGAGMEWGADLSDQVALSLYALTTPVRGHCYFSLNLSLFFSLFGTMPRGVPGLLPALSSRVTQGWADLGVMCGAGDELELVA